MRVSASVTNPSPADPTLATAGAVPPAALSGNAPSVALPAGAPAGAPDADSAAAPPLHTWGETLRALWDWRVLSLLMLGFSAGLPLLLIFSSLSLWLMEAGVERRAVTFFSWAALGYSFKFVWAPLVDRLPLPWLTARLGRRRAYMLLAQVGVACAIVGMAMTDPAQGPQALVAMALFAVMLGFMSATQDIVIDAYRIEIARPEQQGLLSAAYIAGYRVGMIVAGAGVLFLAAHWGTSRDNYQFEAWQSAYLIMAAVMGIGMLTTLLTPEPESSRQQAQLAPAGQHLRLLGVFLFSVAGFVGVFWGLGTLGWQSERGAGALLNLLLEASRMALALGSAFALGAVLIRLGLADREQARITWVEPLLDFFKRYGWHTAALLLALVGLYRISDIVLGVISNIFYQDMGFTKPEIATAVKTYGLAITIFGGFLGGILAYRIGVMRALLWGAILSALTNLAFIALAYAGRDLTLLYWVVSLDNLAAGFASAAFVAFLSSLTNIQFTAVQYAIFSSLMTLLPKTLGGYSGAMVDGMGYPGFFMLTALLGVPVIALVLLAKQRLQIAERPP
ncbi:permease of the major facilitator superfamily [Serpentinimonas maccroryi]|uniref:Permease of the major facilitator superfamily n=1 Tax=Serpentinimonas maccroryi TaxID=1458426 RepID=A0A060NJH8_9BURK|nr:MFS transporter [Serpentinimonas maccroryi]BAO82446.1 permease of the major facilitator superfamily [Serpentinimonas maccroryi]